MFKVGDAVKLTGTSGKTLYIVREIQKNRIKIKGYKESFHESIFQLVKRNLDENPEYKGLFI